MSSQKSRIPATPLRRPASTKSLRTPASPSTTRSPSPTKPSTPTRLRTKSTAKASTPRAAASSPTPAPALPKTNISIREAIALKRAEAKKSQLQRNSADLTDLQDAVPDAVPAEEADLLGRRPIRETIEKSKTTGSLNLCARDPPLQCLPSALFEIILSITPGKISGVDEQALPPSPQKTSHAAPAWYEIQDLTILKAFNNEIVAIQPEISMFGSLKTIDLHNNKLSALPESFPDLANLSVLDLSYNSLTSIPPLLWALPELTYLNLSFNGIEALDFGAAFDGDRVKPSTTPTSDFFAPQIQRSSKPCPRLVTLEVRGNKLTPQSIGERIPTALSKLDLSENPIGEDPSDVKTLLRRLSVLQNLKELRFDKTQITDRSFASDVFQDVASAFSSLQLISLEECKVTVPAIETGLAPLKRDMRFTGPADKLSPDSIRVVVGKKDLREPWEIEAEERFNRTRSPAAAPNTSPPAAPTRAKPVAPKEVVKEAWEIEAEQGLLTEGGRRRARAEAARKAEAELLEKHQNESSSPASPPPQVASLLAAPQYYNASTHTLTLPSSTVTKPIKQHARAFSFAGPSALTGDVDSNLAIPTPTLPLALITVQPFQDTLKVLVCNSRRKDRSIMLPSQGEGPVLPRLTDLEFEGCQLPNDVAVSRVEEGANPASAPTTQTTQPLLPLLTNLFPTLTYLNLAHNMLTSAALTPDVVSALVLAGPSRAGLRQLALRGNRIDGLEGFEALASRFKGNREVEEYKLEELDVRENEIARLPPILGLLPLDVFLVEGNIFRVPQRKVWEREGSRGLLSWLRGRIE
ncbi:hypothetical protein DL96DRAFT_320010 [Flagelloscypha sp. PMI_526]|nr:hypothetical protein DL96DRAFT_320010 [Flagelloscypha sp. PMI_526]